MLLPLIHLSNGHKLILFQVFLRQLHLGDLQRDVLELVAVVCLRISQITI